MFIHILIPPTLQAFSINMPELTSLSRFMWRPRACFPAGFSRGKVPAVRASNYFHHKCQTSCVALGLVTPPSGDFRQGNGAYLEITFREPFQR